MWSRNVRSLTLCTSTPATSSTAATTSSAWSASAAEHVTSTTRRSWLESATSIAVTIPPAAATAVATAPTTPWSGAVWRRMVIEYDDGVADMTLRLAGARPPTEAAARAEHDGREHAEGHQLGGHDGADQQVAMHVVQPPGEATAGEGRPGLDGSEDAVGRGEPGRRNQVCHQRLDRRV